MNIKDMPPQARLVCLVDHYSVSDSKIYNGAV